jgi:hypothetical protein
MSGRPVHLLTAAIAAAASLLSVSAASASCYSGCGGYAAPVAYYSAPVVYSYSYAAPAAYAAPCSPCGYSSYGHAPRMYVVNQGPAYAAPVVGEAEGVYDTGYRRAYPHYGDGGLRWHRRHWHHRGHGYRHHGYRHHGYRGYRGGFAYRHGWRARHPMVGPGGIYRGPRYRTGLIVPKRWGGAIPPRHWNAAVRPHRMGGGQMHIMRQPGAVHPRQGGGMKKMP